MMWLAVAALAVCWVVREFQRPYAPDEYPDDQEITCWECGGTGSLIREGDQEIPCWACEERF